MLFGPVPGRGSRAGWWHDDGTVPQLRDLLLTLPDSERAWLAEELLASFDGAPDEGVEEAWAAEIERRASEVRAGQVKLLGWDEVSTKLEALLDGR